jgi:hypothetical protein
LETGAETTVFAPVDSWKKAILGTLKLGASNLGPSIPENGEVIIRPKAAAPAPRVPYVQKVKLDYGRYLIL